jgi:molybdopterin-guanine dinucleotide biosynthesis protein MobB
MNIAHPRTLHVVGGKKSGKTTQIEFIISELHKEGFEVGAIKHSSDCQFIDKVGSDSDRFRNAGAAPSAFSTLDTLAICYKDIALEDQKSILTKLLKQCDLVVIESFRHAEGPKIWLSGDQDLSEAPQQTIAIIAENRAHRDIPVFPYNDPLLASFIISYYKLNTRRKRRSR